MLRIIFFLESNDIRVLLKKWKQFACEDMNIQMDKQMLPLLNGKYSNLFNLHRRWRKTHEWPWIKVFFLIFSWAKNSAAISWTTCNRWLIQIPANRRTFWRGCSTPGLFVESVKISTTPVRETPLEPKTFNDFNIGKLKKMLRWSQTYMRAREVASVSLSTELETHTENVSYFALIGDRKRNVDVCQQDRCVNSCIIFLHSRIRNRARHYSVHAIFFSFE